MFLEFELDESRIASRPTEKRSDARLLVSTAEGLSDSKFSELPDFLSAGDLIVFNRTQVRKCRLFARRLEDDREEIEAR